MKLARLLVAHPPLTLELSAEDLKAFAIFGEEACERLCELVAIGKELGEFGGFAALSQRLKEAGSDYDTLIAEIASESESDIDSERQLMISAVRQIKVEALKHELNQLILAGPTSDSFSMRYREITAQQDLLAREEAGSLAPR